MKDNETLAIRLSFNPNTVKVTGKYRISYADSVDMESETKGSVVPPDDPDFFGAVLPADTWNAIQDRLHELNVSSHDLNQMSVGRAYRFSFENTAIKCLPEIIAVVLKMTMGYDPSTRDLIDTLRFGQHKLDPELHPFVLMTRACWNSFQLGLDRLKIREEVRKCRPLSAIVRHKNVTILTHEEFAKQKPIFEG